MLCAALTACRLHAEDVAALRKALLEPAERDYGLWVPEGDAKLKTIATLKAMGSKEAVEVLRDFLTTGYGADRKLKQHALVALGNIGSEDAVRAIRDFEKWRDDVRANPPPFRFGNYEHAIDHFAPQKLQPLVRWKSADGRERAFFLWHRFGKALPYATTQTAEGGWEAPVLLDAPDLNKAAFAQGREIERDGDAVFLRAGNDVIRIDTDVAARDSDKDGLPDVMERLFGTDPANVDTDKDGGLDGADAAPMTPPVKLAGDEAEIRQAVFAVLLATSNNRDAVVLVEDAPGREKTEPPGKPEFTRQEYRGFGGCVLRSERTRNGFVNITRLGVRMDSPTTATANISDWEGPEAASVHEAKLKKIHGKWVVTEFKIARIS